MILIIVRGLNKFKWLTVYETEILNFFKAKNLSNEEV